MAERKLAVVITGDAKGAVGAFKATNTAAGGTQSKMQSVAGGVTKAFKTAAVAGGLVGAGLAAGLEKSAGTYKSLVGESAKLQRFLGGSIEEASRFRFVAQQSGIATDTMARGLGLFNKNAVSGKLDGLITNLRDSNGQLRPMSELLPEVAEKFAKMENGPEKTALAMKLFGKSGADLIPLLNKGADGFGELSKKAEELGLVLTDKDAKAMKEANANSRLWTASLQGVQVQIGRYVLPVLTKFVSFLASKMPGVVQSVAAGAKTMAHAFAPFIAQVGPALQKVADFLRPIVDRIREFFANNPDARFAALATVLGGVVLAAVVTLGTALVGLFSPVYLVVGAVALLVAGVIYAYKHFEGFRNVVNAVAGFVTGTLWPALQSLGAWFADALPVAAGLARDAFGWIATKAAEVYVWFSANVLPVLQTVASWLATNVPVAAGLARDALGWIATKAAELYFWFEANVLPTMQTVASWLSTNVPVAAGLARDALGWIVSKATELYNWFSINVLPVLRSVASFVSTTLVAALTAGRNWIGFVIDKATEFYAWFNDNVLPVIQKVADYLTQKLGPGLSVARDVIGEVITKARELVAWFLVNLGPQLEATANFLKGAFKVAFDIATGTIDTMWGAVQTLWRWLDKVLDVAGKVAGAVSNIPGVGAVGNVLGAIGVPGFAAGGRPPVGRLSVVGERGPELFVPDRPGTIVPAASTRSMLGGRGGGDTYVTIQMNGPVLDGRELGRLAAEGLNEYGASQNAPIIATGLVGGPYR